MGLLDDAASVVSARPSHSKHSKYSSSKSGGHRSSKYRSRSKSTSDSSGTRKRRTRSRSRTRSHYSSSHATLPGVAASIFGVGGGDDRDRYESRPHNKNRESSSRSFFGLGGGDKHRSSSRHGGNSRAASSSSFFGLGGNGNASTRSFFGLGGSSHSHGPSYYKRSPRPNFLHRAYRHLKRLLRDLVYYAKRHPVKVFMLVVMPLVTGGFLTALLARFGLRLPKGLERMLGLAAKAGSGDSIGLVGEAVRMASGGFGGGAVAERKVSLERGRQGGFQWEKRRVEEDVFPKVLGGGGGDWGVGGLVSGVAKMFM